MDKDWKTWGLGKDAARPLKLQRVRLTRAQEEEQHQTRMRLLRLRMISKEGKMETEYDELQTFNIFIEGYAITGQNGTAKFIGAASGFTFEQACEAFSRTPTASGYGSFSKSPPAFWGCRLFNTLQEAQQSFG